MSQVRAVMSKEELRHLRFITDLPYPELVEAHKIIDKGPDVALLYFWYNLLKAHYWPLFSNDDVEKQAVYFANKYPEWEGQIINWFNDYLDRIKNASNNPIKRTA